MILAYDTSSDILSMALFKDEKKFVEFESPLFTKHSTSLVPIMDAFLKKQKKSLADLEVLAVGLGPGSFTGLRVGITVAKVLAYVLKKPVMGISSLEAIARGASSWNGPVAVILDARKEKLYAAVYEGKKTIQKPVLTTLGELLKELKKPTLFVGDAVVKYTDQIRELGARSYHQVMDEAKFCTPKALSIARIARERLEQKKKFSDPFRLEPMYLHARDCNVMRAVTHE